MAFVLKQPTNPEVMKQPLGPMGRLGRCRFHAPTMKGFPVVFEMDWCLDHKLSEDAV
jgi:hypothetical protein